MICLGRILSSCEPTFEESKSEASDEDQAQQAEECYDTGPSGHLGPVRCVRAGQCLYTYWN